MSREPKGKKAKMSFYIITEGETEKRYFLEFRQKNRCSAVTIKKIKPCSGQILNVAKRVWKNERFTVSKYNKQAIIIDKDALTEDEFNTILRAAKEENIGVFFSNSAFEVWLLAHFEPITKGIFTGNELKRRLSNYLRGEYKKGDKAQLSAIVDHFEEAIVNTRNVSDLSYHTQCTNVGNLCQSIHGDL